SRGFRIENQVINRVALLIGDSNQQVLQDLAVNFDVPGLAPGIPQSSGNDIGIGKGRSYLPAWIECQESTIGKKRKRTGVQGHAVVKQPASRLEQGPTILC